MASKSVKLGCVVLMCMVVLGAVLPMAQAITCGQVSSSLVPCLSYLQHGGAVPQTCCGGVKSILNSARTTADRQATCNCLKQAAGAVHGINPQFASGLPGRCGVNIPYKISTSTNCASIK